MLACAAADVDGELRCEDSEGSENVCISEEEKASNNSSENGKWISSPPVHLYSPTNPTEAKMKLSNNGNKNFEEVKQQSLLSEDLLWDEKDASSSSCSAEVYDFDANMQKEINMNSC